MAGKQGRKACTNKFYILRQLSTYIHFFNTFHDFRVLGFSDIVDHNFDFWRKWGEIDIDFWTKWGVIDI